MTIKEHSTKELKAKVKELDKKADEARELMNYFKEMKDLEMFRNAKDTYDALVATMADIKCVLDRRKIAGEA